MEKEIHVELPGRDTLHARLTESGDILDLNIQGCPSFLSLIRGQISKFGKNIYAWQESKSNSHEDLLLKEFLLKAKDQWSFPYTELELCHCRKVSTLVIDHAIVSGAHTPEAVSRLTSAATACGTCRPQIEKIIAFRLS